MCKKERQKARQEHRKHLTTSVQLCNVIYSYFRTEMSVQRHSATQFWNVLMACISLKAVILKLPFLSVWYRQTVHL